MEKYIQQWINQEVQIIEHIKIQIIYQISDKTNYKNVNHEINNKYKENQLTKIYK